MLDSERKRKLIGEMKKGVNGADWITRSEVKKSLGYKKEAPITKILKDLPKFNSKYLIFDVVDRIISNLRR